MSALPGTIGACRNRRVYESSEVVRQYASLAEDVGLFPSERAILERLRAEARGGSVLDIGVGAGRTTRALADAHARYVGIDYAASMVARCRQDFPDLDFRQQDARALVDFPPAQFDSVWFSFNGIDYVRWPDRARVLGEVARVLKPGGTFVFATHNLHAPPKPPGRWPEWRTEGSLLRRVAANIRRLARHASCHFNYRTRRSREIRREGYALLIDSAHGYRLMTACVTPRYQRQQLREAGFDGVEVIGQDGRVLAEGAMPGDSWLYYVARKR